MRRTLALLVLALASCSKPPAEPIEDLGEAPTEAPPSPSHEPPAAPSPAPAAEAPAAPATPFDPAHPSAAGMRWTAPAALAFRAPSSEMRLAEYVVGRVGEEDVAMTVFHFPGMGGGIDANLQRWIGQFTQPDGSSTLAATRVESSTVNGLRVTVIAVTGHFEGGAMGGGTGDGYKLLGAIAEAPQGPVFFKLVGPRAIVDAAEPGVLALIASFAPSAP